MKRPNWTADFAGLAQLDGRLRDKLEGASRIRKFKEGALIFGAGESPPGMLFLTEGTVRVHQRSESGRDIVLYRVTAGESCVMTTACLFTQQSYLAEGIAETDVMAAEVPRQTFDAMVADSPQFRDFLLAAYSNRILDLFRVIDDVVFGRMDLRIAERLLQQADSSGVAQITHQELANELGSAREVISRQLQEFQNRGWIEQRRGRVTLRDAAALAEFASAG